APPQPTTSKRLYFAAPAGFTMIHVCTANPPRQPNAFAAYTCTTASGVFAGSGASPVASIDAWCHGTGDDSWVTKPIASGTSRTAAISSKASFNLNQAQEARGVWYSFPRRLR